MPKGKTMTLAGAMEPLLRYLDRRSTDVRTVAREMLEKEVARMNARPKAQAAKTKAPQIGRVAPPLGTSANFKAAAGLKSPAKKSHKKKAPAAPKPQGGGENTAGESQV